MKDNFYFLFLDEIYAPNLNDCLHFTKKEVFERESHLHFGLAGIIIAANSLKDLNFKSLRIKNRYYPRLNNLIFHYVDILNHRDNYTDLEINLIKRNAFCQSLRSFVEKSEFRYTAAFIDKHEFIKKFGVFNIDGKILKIQKVGSNLFPKSSVVNYNLYLLTLKRIMISFFEFLSDLKARGVIIAEARGEKEDTELRQAFHKIQCSGIASITPTEIRKIILDLFIVPKKQNYIGTQLADLIIYPSYDGLVPYHNQRLDHFVDVGREAIKSKFLGKGVEIIP